MYVITFTKDIPSGFARVTVDDVSDSIIECLEVLTNRYMRNNHPELVQGDDAYDTKCATSKSWSGNEYVVDRYNVNDYTFTVEDADTL